MTQTPDDTTAVQVASPQASAESVKDRPPPMPQIVERPLLFTLRYRAAIKGVTTTFVEATTFTEAEVIGRAWIAKQAGYKYIGLERSVITAADVGLSAAALQHAATSARVGA